MKLIKALLAVLMVLMITSCTTKQDAQGITEQQIELVKQDITDQEIELVKQDIISEYGFEWVAWQGIEKVEHDRGDFYLFTCIVEEDELYQYTFAVRVEYNKWDEIDIDTWRVYEKGGAE
jgi:hypothetical protein